LDYEIEKQSTLLNKTTSSQPSLSESRDLFFYCKFYIEVTLTQAWASTSVALHNQYSKIK